MILALYHGSGKKIEKPEFGVGNPANDYGLGFYCTQERNLACEWGVAEYRNGFANRYEFETEGLEIIDLNTPRYCTLHWLAVLVGNREFDLKYPQQRLAAEYLAKNFSVDVDKADVIVGYRFGIFKTGKFIAVEFQEFQVGKRHFVSFISANTVAQRA